MTARTLGHRARPLAIVVATAAALAVVGSAAPAQAASYRYWTYWTADAGSWSFAAVGPASRIPADGTVEGWRFAVTGVTGTIAPRSAADFAMVCGATPAETGAKRIAVVVDPGTADDAPEGESPPGPWATCIVATERATALDVLRTAASLRFDRGLICAIDGYPARGCGTTVDTDAPTPQPSPSRPSPPAEATPPAPTPRPTAEPTPSMQQTPSPAPEATASPRPDSDRRGSPSGVTEVTPGPSAASPTGAGPARAEGPQPEPTPSVSLVAAGGRPPGGPGDTGLPLGTLLAVVAIAGLGTGAWAIARRRRAER